MRPSDISRAQWSSIERARSVRQARAELHQTEVRARVIIFKSYIGLIIGIDNYYLIVLKDEKITVRTHCIRCGSQIEVKSKIYQGRDFTELLKLKQVHSNDPYTLVHLLCEKCDMMRGFQDEADKENTLARERIRKFSYNLRALQLSGAGEATL